MKVVELYGRVRYAVQIEGLSRREAARRGRDRGCRGGDSHGAGDGYPQPGANQRNARCNE